MSSRKPARTTNSSRSRRPKVKSGVNVSVGRRTTSNKSTKVSASRTRSSRVTKIRRVSKKPRQSGSAKSKTKQSSFISKILQKIIIFLLMITAFLMFFQHWVVLNVILRVDQPKSILIVPKSISEASSSANLLLVRLDPTGKHKVVEIAGDQDVLVGKYGSYKLAMVYPLLHLDNQSGQYVGAVFGQVLGLPLDQVVALEPAGQTSDWQDIFNNQLRSQVFNKTWWQLRFILDSDEMLVAADIQEAIKHTYSDSSIISAKSTQNCPIAVSNATKTSGLAAYTTTLIENIGGLVIRVATEYDQQDRTRILYSSDYPGCQDVAEILARFFPSVEVLPDEQNLTGDYRSRILVLLGDDMDSFTPFVEEE